MILAHAAAIDETQAAQLRLLGMEINVIHPHAQLTASAVDVQRAYLKGRRSGRCIKITKGHEVHQQTMQMPVVYDQTFHLSDQRDGAGRFLIPQHQCFEAPESIAVQQCRQPRRGSSATGVSGLRAMISS